MPDYYKDELHRVTAIRKILAMIDRAQDEVDYWIDDYFTISENGLPTIDDSKRVKREMDTIANKISDMLDNLEIRKPNA